MYCQNIFITRIKYLKISLNSFLPKNRVFSLARSTEPRGHFGLSLCMLCTFVGRPVDRPVNQAVGQAVDRLALAWPQLRLVLTLKKDRTSVFIFNRSERRLTYQHLQKISRRQANDQREGSNMDITNSVKQIVSQTCL